MNELKPCPFCGNEKVTINLYKKRGTPSGDDGWNAEIRCKCHALVRFWALKKSWARQSAIETWNERVDQGQSEKVAGLKRELKRVKQERDAAVKDLDALRKKTGWKCDCCYYNDNYNRDVCTGCDYNSDNNWKWRGLKEE